jgi:hypothetical protein
MALKLIYLFACILSLANAAWMIFFPLSWYTDLPAAVPHTGPFNQHFIRDIGVAFAVAGAGFGWCAFRLDRSRPVHYGLTLFFAGHALVHLADITTGHLPQSHWLIDAPSVFLPALLLLILSVPTVRKHLGEDDRE